MHRWLRNQVYSPSPTTVVKYLWPVGVLHPRGVAVQTTGLQWPSQATQTSPFRWGVLVASKGVVFPSASLCFILAYSRWVSFILKAFILSKSQVHQWFFESYAWNSMLISNYILILNHYDFFMHLNAHYCPHYERKTKKQALTNRNVNIKQNSVHLLYQKG